MKINYEFTEREKDFAKAFNDNGGFDNSTQNSKFVEEWKKEIRAYMDAGFIYPCNTHEKWAHVRYEWTDKGKGVFNALSTL